MNTLGATLSGRTSLLDAATARGPDPEAAGAISDIFGAVLGALKGAPSADASRAADPDGPAGRRPDPAPEAATPASPGETVNPLFLLAAIVPARSDASPLSPPRESLETLVARTLPAGIPALDAGVGIDPATALRLPVAGEGTEPTVLSTPDARTRVTVLRRETHFAPVLPQILAAPTPAPAMPVPAGTRDGPIPAAAPAATPMPLPSPGPTLSGLVTPDLVRPGSGNDLREAQTGPAAPMPFAPVEMRPSPALAQMPALPAADAPAVQAVSSTEPAPLPQAGMPAPARVDPMARAVPAGARAAAAPPPGAPSVAAASPGSDGRGPAMPLADAKDHPQAPLPASASPGEMPPPGGTPRGSEAVPGTGTPAPGKTAPEPPNPGDGVPPVRPAETRPSRLGGASPRKAEAAPLSPPAPQLAQPHETETVANPVVRERAAAGMPGPAARNEAPPAGSDRHRTEAAPALPSGRASGTVTAPAPPTPDSHLGAVRSGEAGSAKPIETAAPGSGGATGLAPPGLSLIGAPPPAAPPPPTQQVAAAILGQGLRGGTVAAPGAAGLDGPLRILTLQLHPADLGTVLVRMRLRDGQLEMSLQASREETATLLAEGGDVLTDLLRQGGYQPERVTIVGGPPPPTEAQAFQTRADAGPDQPPPDQSGRRQPEGRAAASPETQPDSHERNHASVTSSPERGGVYL